MSVDRADVGADVNELNRKNFTAWLSTNVDNFRLTKGKYKKVSECSYVITGVDKELLERLKSQAHGHFQESIIVATEELGRPHLINLEKGTSTQIGNRIEVQSSRPNGDYTELPEFPKVFLKIKE